MEYAKFLSNLGEKEKKLLAKAKKDEEIMLLVSDGSKSLVGNEGKVFSPGIMILAHMNTSHKICVGTIGERQIMIGDQLGEEDFMRVIVDTRDKEDVRHYLHYKEQSLRMDNDTENSNDLLVAYVESSDFAQLSLYDGQLEYKTSDIFVITSNLRKQVRTIAFSLLKRLYPELDLTLPELLPLGGGSQ